MQAKHLTIEVGSVLNILDALQSKVEEIARPACRIQNPQFAETFHEAGTNLFRGFRGRDPKVEPLLIERGLRPAREE